MQAASETFQPIAAYQIDDVLPIENWQDRITWPVPTVRLLRLGKEATLAILSLAAEEKDDDVRRLILVAGSHAVYVFMALGEAALAVQAETKGSTQVLGGPPYIEALRGNSYRNESQSDFAVAPIAHGWLRGLVRTASWTPAHRLLSAMAAPRATAISHNSLLRQAAAADRIDMRHAPNILHAARRAGGKEDQTGIDHLVESIVFTLVSKLSELENPYKDRLSQLAVQHIEPFLKRVASDLKGLKKIDNLPHRIWCGTAGAYTTRVICAEVRRRQGHVTVFDHGGDTAISQLVPSTALSELAFASKYVVGTRTWADLLRTSGALELIAPINSPEIGHGGGEPLFRQACRDTSRLPSKNLRVLLVGHPFRSTLQFAIPAPPDPLYLDFQMRVAKCLSALDVDLLCKPHPEGFSQLGWKPLAKVYSTSDRPFEDHLDDTDVFVFDAPTSTTFAEALCTDRPVVLIDRPNYPLNPNIDTQIRSRCSMIKAWVGDEGRININWDELRDVVANPKRDIDPGYFRRLLADR